MLTPTILARFERSLAAVGAHGIDHLNPGLTDSQIDELAQSYDVAVPEEALMLWRWHDGRSDAAPPTAQEIVPGRRFLPLDRVLSARGQLADGWRDIFGFDQIIQPFTEVPMIFLDCRGPSDAPVPILVSHDFESPKPVLPSIGDLFRTWTQFLEDGVWRIKEDGMWDGSYVQALSDEILERGIF